MKTKNMHLFCTAVLLAVLCCIGSAVAQIDLVKNGSFEVDPLPGSPGYTQNISGWTVAGQAILNGTSGPFYTSNLGTIPQGSKLSGMQGAGSLSQAILGLAPGASHTFSFYYNLRTGNPGMKLTVKLGTQTLFGPTVITTKSSFTSFSFPFTYNLAWGNVLKFEFSEPQGDNTIMIDNVKLTTTATPQTFKVTPSISGGNGTVSPNTQQTVYAHGSSAFTFTPAAGYRLYSILVNGARSNVLPFNYTINDITADTTIVGSFSLPEWSFNTDNFLEGWEPLVQIADWEVSNGTLRYNIESGAADPSWTSQPLNLQRSSFRWMKIIARNDTGCDGSIIYFDDNTIPGFAAGHEAFFRITPKDTQLSEYWVDFEEKATWNAATTIERFRFDFPDQKIGSSGSLTGNGTFVEVDHIALLPASQGPPPPTASSIKRESPLIAPPAYTKGVVAWEVRLNHNIDITTLGLDDVAITATGTAMATMTGATLNPTQLLLGYTTTGTGTVRLDLVSGGTARDIAGQPFVSYTAGEVFNVDNDGPAITIGAPSKSVTNTGPVTYTVTYTDSGSGFSACTLAAANITLNKTGTANGTVQVTGSGNTRTVSINNITGNGTLGISIAANTATDTLGNLSLAKGPSATFTVDNVLPTATCKDITVKLSAPQINAQAIDDGSADNGTIVEYLIDGASNKVFNCSHMPSTQVTLSVKDGAGNISTCQSQVTVEDDIAPVITLNGENNVTAECGAKYTDAGATVVDNCDSSVTVTVDNPVDTDVVGSYTVTYTAKDASGNETTQTRTVTVQDTLKPVITRGGVNNVTVELGNTYTDAGATALDQCEGTLTDSIVTVNPVDTNQVGTYTVRYNVSDEAGNAANEVTRIVHVRDTQNPYLLGVSVIDGSTVSLSFNKEMNNSAKAAENYSVSGSGRGTLDEHPNSVTVGTGNSYLLHWSPTQEMLTGGDITITVATSVKDIHGNDIDAAGRVMTDSGGAVGEAPIIDSCPADRSLGSDENCQAAVPNLIPEITAHDNCTATASLIFTQDPIAGTLIDETTEVTLTVKDEVGHESPCTLILTVEDQTAPTAICQDLTVYLSSPFLSAAMADAGSSDNCGITSLLINDETGLYFGASDMGEHEITLQVADSAGNSDSCTAALTVVDDIAPDAHCKDITVYLSAPTITAAAIDDGSTDNVAITSMLINGAEQLSFDTGDVGTQTVTLRVEDAAGNADECDALITIVDDLPDEGETPSGFQVTAVGNTHIFVSEGASATFTVTVSGAQSLPSYQWYRHTEDKALNAIPDAISASYTIGNVSEEDLGEYQCEVYDSVADETAWSPIFILSLISGVPTSALAGLALIAALTGLVGARTLRRK